MAQDSRQINALIENRFESQWQAFLHECVLRGRCNQTLPGWLTLAGDQLSCLIRLTDEPAIVRNIQGLQGRLARHDVLMPHPEPFLHLTVRMLGVVSHDFDLIEPVHTPIPLRDLSAAIAEGLQGQPAFRIELRGVNSWPEAPFVQVFDDGGILDLRRRISAALPAVPDRAYSGGFLPHLTLGYYRFGVDLAGIAEELAGLRGMPLGDFMAHTVELVWGKGTKPHPELITLGTFSLA